MLALVVLALALALATYRLVLVFHELFTRGPEGRHELLCGAGVPC